MKRYKINSGTNCYEWIEEILPNKYPKIKFDGRVCDAHVFIAALFVRTLRAGDRVIHSCDNKKCINPEHISVVPLEENIVYCWDGIKPEDDNHDKKSSLRAEKNSSDDEWALTQLDLVKKLSKSYNLSKSEVIELALNNLNDMTEVLDSLITKE